MTKERFVQVLSECGITDTEEIDRCWDSACRTSGLNIESIPDVEAMKETSLRRTLLEIYIPRRNKENDLPSNAMTKEKFREIMLSCGYDEASIDRLWDTRPTDELEEDILREHALIMKSVS